MIKIVDYNPDHLDKLKPKSVYDPTEDHRGNIETLVKSNAGKVKTLVDEEKVLAVCGFSLLRRGVAEFWAITSEEVKERPIAFHKSVKYLIFYIENHLNLHRTQITVSASFDEGRRWAEGLGFEEEARLKKYGADGSDHIMYARTR